MIILKRFIFRVTFIALVPFFIIEMLVRIILVFLCFFFAEDPLDVFDDNYILDLAEFIEEKLL